MEDIKLSNSDALEIEKEASSQNVTHDNMFSVIPDDVSRTMVISTSIQGATLKLGVQIHARHL